MDSALFVCISYRGLKGGFWYEGIILLHIMFHLFGLARNPSNIVGKAFSPFTGLGLNELVTFLVHVTNFLSDIISDKFLYFLFFFFVVLTSI